MDRLFYSELCGDGNKALYMKPAASVVAARRAGNTSAFDQLNKYFTIQEMPIVSSKYWNMIFGANAEQAKQDAEGLYTMCQRADERIPILLELLASCYRSCLNLARENGIKSLAKKYFISSHTLTK